MKKYLRSFICLAVSLFLFPVLCAAKTDIVSNPSATSGRVPANGEFTISVQENGVWEKIGTLSYDKHLTEKKLSLNNLRGTAGKVGVKIEHRGGGAAHIDSVFLDGNPPVEVKSVDDGLMKLSRKDLDVIDAFGKTIELVFDATAENKALSLTARIESTVISKIPFQFPTANTYRKLDGRSSFYTYRLNSEQESIPLDAALEGVAKRKPFFKEFSRTGSGHPSGYTYGWVWNDDKNLYVAMDFTPDNTMDGDKDYAKVYTNVDGKIREFKISVPEQTWGTPGFTYTGNVGYQHKTYEFTLPFKEIFPGDMKQNKEIQLAFAAYGTASAVCPTQPEITYTCPFTLTPPTIDGTVSLIEWPGSPRFNIPSPINTYFYCMVDGANLYVMVDAVGDTSTSYNHDTCDECLLTFWQGGVSPMNAGEIYTDTGPTIVQQMPTGGGGAVGYGTSQNSLAAHRIYEWKFPLSSINTVPGGSVFFSSPAVFKTGCGAPASMPFDGTLNNDNVWPLCLDGTDSATWGVLQFPTDSDGDGIPDAIEDGAPNGGDGNGDGIPDRLQGDVTSLPSATGNGYLTLETTRPGIGAAGSRSSAIPSISQNSEVQALTEATQPQQDGGFRFPFGLLSFKVQDIGITVDSLRTAEALGSLTVTIYYHGATNLTGVTYRKYGPFPTPFGTAQWYTMPGVTYGTATVGTASVPTATFTIIDNGIGDDDGTIGIIVDQGGVGDPVAGIPTMTEWGMITFIVLAGIGSVYYLSRRRRIES